jgi:hypothetical protein
VRTKPFKFTAIQLLAITLAVFLAGLSTLAKNSQYLPKSNPAHYLSIASKMKAADTDCSSAPVELQLAQPDSRISVPKPPVFVSRCDQREAPPVQRAFLAVCLRHRAPPATRS